MKHIVENRLKENAETDLNINKDKHKVRNLKLTPFIFFITLAIVTGPIFAACRTLSLGVVITSNLSSPPNSRIFQQSEDLVDLRLHPNDTSTPSCAHPMPDEVKECNELEQQILASTLRLKWRFKIKNDDGSGYTLGHGNMGLATIREGRYLVTHNHSNVPLSGLKKGELTTVSVFSADGKPIWVDGPLEAITIAVENPETLVLDFDSYSGEGLFGSRGMASAKFKAWESLPLQSGMEVAQLNWDGVTIHIDWVTIEEVRTENGPPRLKLTNYVIPGASGGGIFWNGNHIANTWSQVTAYDESKGVVLYQHSVAALNSPQVTAQLQN